MGERLAITQRVLICTAAFVVLSGCSKTRSAEAVAQEFVDAYYIERDHQKALAVSTGVAADRVRTEAKLVEDGKAAGATSSAVLPHVYYKLKQKETTGGDNTLLYALTVDSGGVQLKKEVRLRVRKMRERDYRVSYFTEADLTAH
jgi:hypothetical protein